MIYEYKCPECKSRAISEKRADRIPGVVCQGCHTIQEFRRVFSINVAPVMQEHFNATVQKPISSNRQFVEELKRESERASLQTGMEHRYEPIDPTDKQGLGVTDEGIDQSNRIRQKQGLPAFKI